MDINDAENEVNGRWNDVAKEKKGKECAEKDNVETNGGGFAQKSCGIWGRGVARMRAKVGRMC